MHYMIDGFNLLFQLDKSYDEKEAFARLLDNYFTHTRWKGTLVFDNKKSDPDAYPSKQRLEQIDVIHTPKGMCADRYIIEYLSQTQDKQIILVTSDNFLAKQAQEIGFDHMGSKAFFAKLTGRKKGPIEQEKPNQEAEDEIQRLLEIFQRNLRREKG